MTRIKLIQGDCLEKMKKIKKAIKPFYNTHNKPTNTTGHIVPLKSGFVFVPLLSG